MTLGMKTGATGSPLTFVRPCLRQGRRNTEIIRVEHHQGMISVHLMMVHMQLDNREGSLRAVYISLREVLEVAECWRGVHLK
jgi:hypothetical protein